MEREDLTKITLETPIYHPFFGMGLPTKITMYSIDVVFNGKTNIEFGVSGVLGKDHFLSEIYLEPIKIVKEN